MLPTALTPVQINKLIELADYLIPAADGHFSASQAGIGDTLLAKMYQLVPERMTLLRKVINQSMDTDAATAINNLQNQSSTEYDTFCQTIAGAYFMSPEVRQQINYPGREAVPARSDIMDMEELLMPVFEGDFAPRDAV